MGAAASMKLIYSEAMDWFKQYFDGVLYIEDFRTLDKDSDGGISYDELQTWLKGKAKDGASWRVIVTNQSIFRIAHKLASKTTNTNALQDDWTEGHDVGNEKLTLDEFKMACRTFSSAQANEALTEQKIIDDFALLDTDKSGTVEFIEVCTYCSNFVDHDFADKFITATTAATARKVQHVQDHSDHSHSESTIKRSASNLHMVDGENIVTGSNDRALDVIAKEMAKNEKIALFEEIKVNTEIMLGVI